MRLSEKRKGKNNLLFLGGLFVQFIPHSREEKSAMLKEAGVKSAAELFADVPKQALLKKPLKLPTALHERDLGKEIEEIAAKNKTAKQLNLFLGAGCYNHFVPAAVRAITGRSEFYTAYTPYQAEISQGMLQAIFEWQTYICMLTGMDVANASMYDGPSACAEAMIMAKNATGRRKVLIAKSVNSEYKAVVATYANAVNLQLKEIEIENLGAAIDNETACCIVQHPDFFGCPAKLGQIEKTLHAKNALLVVAVAEALSLAFFGKAKEADIVAAEARSFGNPMGFGGHSAGAIACRQRFMRHIPGRLAGKTTDSEGKPGFVLTLQAREQHIRREKAGSNICSNQALCALAATVYLAVVGEKGLREIAEENHRNAEYLAEKLERLGFSFPFGKDFFNEFVVKRRGAGELQSKLLAKGIVFGYSLGEKFPELQDCLLVAATEMNSREEIDSLAMALGEVQ